MQSWHQNKRDYKKRAGKEPDGLHHKIHNHVSCPEEALVSKIRDRASLCNDGSNFYLRGPPHALFKKQWSLKYYSHPTEDHLYDPTAQSPAQEAPDQVKNSG
uniref:Uncharacterized protein n=1 Tax=Cannabis sativa TaxID=3483 RepID=A0A803QRR1_CANSA